jgi:hypothetical protein
MSRNEQMDENVPPLLSAGLACLACVPIVYLATRPIVWLTLVPGVQWLVVGLFTILPVSVAFIVLYRSAWHEERPRLKRIFSAMMSACIIFGVDLFAVGVLVVVGCLIAGLIRVVGGN